MKESRSVEKETKGRDLTSFRKKNEQNKFEVMRWRCICWEGVKTMAPVEEKISSLKYQEILEENLWPVFARHGIFSRMTMRQFTDRDQHKNTWSEIT